MRRSKLVRMPNHTIAPGAIMQRIGELDSITDGGGVIFQTSHGPYLEYTEGVEHADDIKEDNLLEVFRTHVSTDIIKQYELDPEDILDLCESMDKDIGQWIKHARGPSLRLRADCIVDVAIYCGWDTVDEEPLVLDEITLHQRWYSDFNDEGPVTTPGCFKPEIIVPEMLATLHSIHQNTYWSLLRGRFPLIPSEARQNRAHPWWQQHGAEIVNKLVGIMKKVAPANYVFEVREETFGYWKKR